MPLLVALPTTKLHNSKDYQKNRGDVMSNKRLSYILYAAIAIVLVVITIGYYQHSNQKITQPKLITQDSMTNPAQLAKEIKITPHQAAEIVKAVPDAQPVITYNVTAPTVEQAAIDTTKAIKNKDPALPQAVTAKSDRTAVVANTEQQKVDVYKINLEKNHKIKAGATVINDKLYPTIGYQAGRVEGLMHFNGAKVKGATVLYTVAQW